VTVTRDKKNRFFARFSTKTQLFWKQKLFSGVFNIVEFILRNEILKLRGGIFFLSGSTCRLSPVSAIFVSVPNVTPCVYDGDVR